MQFRRKKILLVCLGILSFLVITGFEGCSSGRCTSLTLRVTPNAGGGDLTIIGNGFKDGPVRIMFQNIPDGPGNLPGGEATAINGGFSKRVSVTCARSSDPDAALAKVYVVGIDSGENIGRARTTASPAWICR